MPVGRWKNEDGRCCKGEDESEYRVSFEGEDKEREHCKPQGNEIQGYAGVVAHGDCTLRSITNRRVGSSNSGSGQLKKPKGKPEYTEQTTDHHRKEVAHDPLKYCCQKKEYRSSKEEYATGTVVVRKDLEPVCLFSKNLLTPQLKEKSLHPNPSGS